jgi:hypothetical protein
LVGVLFSEDDLAVCFVFGDGEDFIEGVALKRFYVFITGSLLVRCNIIIHTTQCLPQRAVEIVLDVVVAAASDLPRYPRPTVSQRALQCEK